MANARAGIEAMIVVISLGLVVGYHVWLLLLRGRGYKPKKKYHDVSHDRQQKCRSCGLFSHVPKGALPVPQVHNCTCCSYALF